MKKMLLILLLSAGASLQIKAQHFIASFGVEHNWNVPSNISHVIYNDYYGYEWVHASRTYREGGFFFDIVLQRGDLFVEVSVRPDGYVTRRISREYYPLHDHVCNNYCGYHANYYNTYYRSCDSHHHHGHNHVAYMYRPNHHSHGHHSYNTYYVYKSEHKHKGHYKKQDKYHKNNHRNEDNSYRERRDTYHDSREVNDSHYDHKGRSRGKSESGRGTYVRRNR